MTEEQRSGSSEENERKDCERIHLSMHIHPDVLAKPDDILVVRML